MREDRNTHIIWTGVDWVELCATRTEIYAVVRRPERSEFSAGIYRTSAKVRLMVMEATAHNTTMEVNMQWLLPFD